MILVLLVLLLDGREVAGDHVHGEGGQAQVLHRLQIPGQLGEVEVR